MTSVELKDFADKVRATYWYVPAVMTLLAIVLALTVIYADQVIPNSWLDNKWYIFHPESITEERNVLNTIGATTLGVIGVVFSITLVPLSIASTQYGSIVLRGFLRDRATQFVLGLYSATTFYCLFVLMGLRSTSNQTALQLPVTVAAYMLLFSLFMLIYFFHHIAESLQASSIINQVSKELKTIIQQDYPLARSVIQPHSRQLEADQLRETLTREGQGVASRREGYVRAINYRKLMHIAVKRNLVLYIKHLPGDFVGHGDHLLRVWPGQISEHLISTVNQAYLVGNSRTLFQDPEYGIELIVTIAARALSPGINDSSTPILCLNRLGSALSMLVERSTPSPYHTDKNNKLCIISDEVRFERVAGIAFNRIRQYGRANTEVLLKMLETIKTINRHCCSEDQRRVLLQHATLIERDSRIGIPSEYDQQRVRERYNETVEAIQRYKIQ